MRQLSGWIALTIVVFSAGNSAFCSEEYAKPPADVSWQRESAEKPLFFKAKLCDREVMYCFAYIKSDDGNYNSAVCRAQEVTDGNGVKKAFMCPTKAEDCGSKDKSVQFPASGSSVLRANAAPVMDASGENDQKKAGTVEGDAR